MSAQRARSAVAAEHRSIFPTLPGVPWWGAVLIAITFTALGFAFDAASGGGELTVVFAGAYVVGCIAAVLGVWQSGVFTAVIQPPLILFVCVPGAYYLFYSDTVSGLKDLVITCGYPLIERFPLMFFTSAVVLLIGMLRWYLAMSSRRAEPAQAVQTESRFSAVTAKISGLLTRNSEGDAADEEPAPRRSSKHSIHRATKASKTTAGVARTRSGKRPVKRAKPSRSRHSRPPETEIIEPVAERPRRPRTARRASDAPVPPAQPRRRPRPSAREARKQPPPSDRRSPYQRPDRHTGFDGFEPFEPHGTIGSKGSANGTTHHPVSRVRYRGADDGDQRPQYRGTPRASGHQAEAWEYDV